MNIKKIKVLMAFYLISTLICSPVFALEFDTSVDDEIRRNYNPDKIEKDMQLPALPKILNENPNTVKQTTVKPVVNKISPAKSISTQSQNFNVDTNQNSQEQSETIDAQTPQLQKASMHSYKAATSVRQTAYISLKKGTKIKVMLKGSVSDRARRGTKLAFVSLYPVSTTYFTIPMGTEFLGEVVDSHGPQLAANGGLIKIRINSFIYNGNTVPVVGYISKANYKKVFFNNIKGKHRYLTSMCKSMNPGKHFFRKMFRVTTSLAQDGSSIIIAPFSFTAGLLALGANVIVSPVAAVFYKGSNISMPQNAHYEIKLSEDAFIYN